MRYPLLPQPPSVYASIVDRDPKHDGIHTSLSLPGASHSRMSCVIQQSLDQCLPVFSSEEEQQLTSGPDELHLHSHLHSRLAICHPNSNHPPQPPSVYASIVDRDPKHDGIHTSLSLPEASHNRMICVIQQSLDQCLPVFSLV